MAKQYRLAFIHHMMGEETAQIVDFEPFRDFNLIIVEKIHE